jgi:zinc protease
MVSTFSRFRRRPHGQAIAPQSYTSTLHRVSSLSCLALSFFVSPLLTAPLPAAPAAFKPVKLFDPATISQRTLPNGVRGVVKETRGTGLVAVQVWVRAGSRYESVSNAGASHLIQDIAMQTSKNYPRSGGGVSGELGGEGGAASVVEALGGVTGAQTSRDATSFSATVGSSFLPAALRALSDATLLPRLTDAEVESAKLEIEAELQNRDSEPLTAVTDLAFRLAFAKHPYKRAALGTSEEVEKLNGKKVRDYHAARYVGSNISVVIVGDVQRDAAHKLIEHYFAGARVGKTVDAIAPETTPLTYNSPVIRRRPIARTATALAFRAPGITNPNDVVAMDVLLSHWSEGREAAMRKVLLGDSDNADQREEGLDDSEEPTAPQTPPMPGVPEPTEPEPLALAFDVNFLTQRDPGLLLFTLVTEPDGRNDAVRATLDEVAGVRQNSIPAAAIARAKTELSRQYIEQGDTLTGQAGALGFYEMISTYEFAVTYLDHIDRITATDIKRVANKYLTATGYVQAVIDAAPRPRTQPLSDQESIPV